MKMRIDKITVKDDWYDFAGFNTQFKEFLNLHSVVEGQEPRSASVSNELKNDPFMVVSFDTSIDVEGFDYQRYVYTIVDALSKIGGILKSIDSGFIAVAAFFCSNTIDITMVDFYYTEHADKASHSHKTLEQKLKYIKSKKFSLQLMLSKIPGSGLFLSKTFKEHKTFLEK